MAVAIAAARDAGGAPLYEVVGVELDSDEGRGKVEAINAGRLIFENTDDRFREALEAAHRRGNLRATTDPEVYRDAAVVVVDVPLGVAFDANPPALEIDGFLGAVRTLGERLPAGALVVIETTVPPGTCERIVAPELEKAARERGLSGDAFLLAHAYERVMPGSRYLDSIVNFWRVYAGHTVEAADACERFLSTVIRVEEYPLTRLHSTTASELGKVLENSYRAANIAFVEEWGRFAEAVGVDLFEVIRAIRVRPTHANLMQPGFGVGGYCLTKDPLFGALGARELYDLELSFPVSERAVAINAAMPLVTLRKVREVLGGSLRGKKILLLGVSYRQDVGDTRYSPSETFVRAAESEGASLTLHDPLVSHWPELDRRIATDLPHPSGQDAVVFAVPHREYGALGPDWLGSDRPLLFDANNVLSAGQRRSFRDAGARVESIGRGEGL